MMKFLKKKIIATFLLAMSTVLIFETTASSAAQLPVDGSITPVRQEIKGSRATATWNLYWDGGDRTTFNVRFNYGVGNLHWKDTRANYKSTRRSFTYSLGSSTREIYRPSLVVSSGNSQAQVNATVVHTR